VNRSGAAAGSFESRTSTSSPSWPTSTHAELPQNEDFLKSVKTGGQVPWTTRRLYGRKVRRVAAAGYTAIQTKTVTTP
jgi:hypothetical protein